MKQIIRDILKLKSEEWYSNKRIKALLASAYVQIGDNRIAKANDITMYYNAIKRQKRNGLEQINGYYIV